ncbi:hypothetical protein NPIL_135681 [Nephila pilipes]|uniref:Gustatory receptor n=1 Tax=Nephila pilipes TaxID=299642 RepID=A0A8X6IDE5_NEPPI|nr:hypothetical protein NPIL_135681 [Nephila pilipes]
MMNSRCSEMNCKRRAAFELYDKITGLMEFFDDTMSFAALCLSLLYSVSVFYFFIKSARDLDKNSAPKLVFSAVSSLIGFLALSSFAAGVNEADKMAKRINGELLKQEWEFHQNQCISKWIPLHFADSERAFKLSGWGFFFFTRSFIPVAFGSLLTYTLLLIQLDRSSSQMTLT